VFGRITTAVLAMGLAATTLSAAPPMAAGTPRPPVTGGFQGENNDHAEDQDNRRGRVSPTARQRNLAERVAERARFNAFGTPALLTDGEDPLTTGLPADPVAAARAYVARNLDLFGLTAEAADALEVVSVNRLGGGAAVLLRQRFGDLVAGHDGLLSVGVRDGAVYFVTSSLARTTEEPAAATLSPAQALRSAAEEAGASVGEVTVTGRSDGWTELSATGLGGTQRARLVAVPTPADGVRSAYEVVVVGGSAGDPLGLTSYVDARTGKVLVTEDLVDHDSDNPEWEVFPSNPPTDYSSTDNRVTWCWFPGLPGCAEDVQTTASQAPWDVDPATGESTETTLGNNARTYHNWFSNDARMVGTEPATPSPTREYSYPWTNQWYEERCNPEVFASQERNDIDAARANLFAMHNRMHDWSYHLGFTEEAWNLQQDNHGRGGLGDDPEQGNAQAGGVTGGPPTFAARDNANQITPPDGVAPITNMYLWQPIAGGFYAPCVDGDYDMSVIGHEYGHAISNRMVAGPSTGLRGIQSRSMGESWSDLLAMEYLNEHGYAPSGKAAFAVGEYVTSDGNAGIRNYNMSDSPLNFSNVAYDIVGQQVHADGEIWSATNFDIRKAMIQRYGEGTSNLQKRCANGETPVGQCPGNRRWVQLVFDSYLLMAVGDVSMVDARDAMLAADRIRFGGANQDLLWNSFAKRGLGEVASSNGADDADPTPSFASPHADEATVTFKPTGASAEAIRDAQLFVGRFQARSSAVADTDPSTPLGSTLQLVPGTYEFVARAPGRGLLRTSLTVQPGQIRDFSVRMNPNLASAAAGAAATGDGEAQASLVDDDEATQWQALGSPAVGKQVTVDLAGGTETVSRIQVSALLAPGQNRFSALRQFRVSACTAGGSVDCSNAADFRRVFTSPADAFPAIAPRPRAPELQLRSFSLAPTRASHLRIEVVHNQCTGGPDFQGEQDDDPRAVTDCSAGSTQDDAVRIAEFQAFTR
jgi:extracellular elastinolytic metalloproteinase